MYYFRSDFFQLKIKKKTKIPSSTTISTLRIWHEPDIIEIYFSPFFYFSNWNYWLKMQLKDRKKHIDLFTILQITFRLKFWLEDQRPLRPMSNCGNKEMRHFFEAECFYWVKTGPPISDFDLHYCLHLTLPTLTETRMKLKTALLSVNIGVAVDCISLRPVHLQPIAAWKHFYFSL